ncbi:calcium-binding protein [Endozoicomonas ascidiicola]|uniref:calcium-binding protein n=1 Tax=Endozoicomonas ascidiicola TaxID=1698521 RepID=UPI0024810E85|nr:type I secretion C-terminal target domain-containing protein [Endozoicomonas ascidiicola]
MYDFASTENEDDALDLSSLLPDSVDQAQLDQYVRVTDQAVYVNDSGDGQFDSDDITATFGAAADLDDSVRLVVGETEIETEKSYLAETTNNRLILNEANQYEFHDRDFEFASFDNSVEFNAVYIKSLPATGTLAYQGEAVTVDQRISSELIDQLVYTADETDGNTDASFAFTVSDGTAESQQASFSLDLRESGASETEGTENAEVIQGAEGADSISAGAGNDTIYGGGGDDILVGEGGRDTYVWRYDDIGSSIDTAEDVVEGFQTGADGDVLDLADLLQEETGAVDELLTLNFQNGDTIIDVNLSAVDGVRQSITLRDVDLSGYGGASSDIEILNNLINDGNLNIDSP